MDLDSIGDLPQGYAPPSLGPTIRQMSRGATWCWETEV